VRRVSSARWQPGITGRHHVFFPGTMVGMLLAGAAPVDAVRLQLILLYALLGSVALAALTAVLLADRSFSPRRTSCTSRQAGRAERRRSPASGWDA
jgi:hypothetical protein